MAIEKYNKKCINIYGPTGRYNYLLNYSSKDISKMPINDIIEKIGLYDSIEDKSDFISKYASFLSKNTT